MKNTFLIIALMFTLQLLTAQMPYQLTTYEYWFNDDFEARLVITPAANNVFQVSQVDASGLDEGVHLLHFRAKDSNGNWSVVQSQSFYSLFNAAGLQGDLIYGYEYWFDDDFENRTIRTPHAAIGLIVQDVDGRGLSEGVHRLHFRTKNVNGIWTVVQSQSFYRVVLPAGSSNLISGYRYMIDNVMLPTVNFSTPVNPYEFDGIFPLPDYVDMEKVHSISFQFKDLNDKWSVPATGKFKNWKENTIYIVDKDENGVNKFLWSQYNTAVTKLQSGWTFDVSLAEPDATLRTLTLTFPVTLIGYAGNMYPITVSTTADLILDDFRSRITTGTNPNLLLNPSGDVANLTLLGYCSFENACTSGSAISVNKSLKISGNCNLTAIGVNTGSGILMNTAGANITLEADIDASLSGGIYGNGITMSGGGKVFFTNYNSSLRITNNSATPKVTAYNTALPEGLWVVNNATYQSGGMYENDISVSIAANTTGRIRRIETWVSVTDILNLPTITKVNIPLQLTGTVIPSDAIEQDVEWSIENSNGISAIINNGYLIASQSGIIDIKATVKDGIFMGEDFTKVFSINVVDAQKDISIISQVNFGGIGGEAFNAVTAVSDGVIAVGICGQESFGTGDWANITGKGSADAIIVKFDFNNNVVWKRNFGGLYSDELNAVIAVSDGIVAVGICTSESLGTGDFVGLTGNGSTESFIVKFDNDGNVIWTKSFGGAANDYFESVAAVSDGVIAAGYSYQNSFNTGDWTGIYGKGDVDAILVKYKNNGELEWKKNFGGSGLDTFMGITSVSDGVIAVGLSSASSFLGSDWSGVSGKGNEDATIVKFKNNGEVEWKKNFGGNGVDSYQSVAASSDAIYAIGVSYGDSFENGDWTNISGQGGRDAIIVKYSLDGNKLWNKNFGGIGADNFASVTTVSDGIIAGGYAVANSFGTGDFANITGYGDTDAFLVKYRTDGELVYKKNFGGINSDIFRSITASSDEIFAVGYSNDTSFGTGNWEGITGKGSNDAIIVKYAFVPITNITGVPSVAKTNVPLVLTSSFTPNNASNRNIIWSVVNSGGTNAIISGSMFFATAEGTATIKATIIDGAASDDYEKTFVINVVRTVSGGNVVSKNNFGGEGADTYDDVKAISDGFIAVGYSEEESFNDSDWWFYVTAKGDDDATIVKYNQDGSVAWRKNFGGSGKDYYKSVIEVSDGFIAVGYSEFNSFGNGNWVGVSGKGDYDAIIVKYNLDGVVVWKKNFGGNGTDRFESVSAVSDGIIAVGYSASGSFGNGDWGGVTGKGNDDAIIVKFDNNGNLVWRKNFGGNANDLFNSVAAVSDGIITVGYSTSGSFGNGDWQGVSGKGQEDAIIVKFDNNGSIVWKKNFGGEVADVYKSVTAVSDGVVAIGYSGINSFGTGDWDEVTGKGYEDAIIVKYDNSGNIVWRKNFGGNGTDLFNSVAVVSDGIIAVGCSTIDSFGNGDWQGVIGKGNTDAIIVKFDNSGDVDWAKNFGGDSDDYFLSVAAVSDGIIAVGYSANGSFETGDWEEVTGKGSIDAIIVKYTFTPVTDITSVTSEAFTNVPQILTASVLPSDASNRNIVWSVVNAGNTNAVISGSMLLTTATGTVTLKAKIIGGTTTGDFEKTFQINVISTISGGNVLSKSNFGGEGDDFYYSVISVSDGVIAVGNSYGGFGSGDWSDVTGKGESDAIIVKYDQSNNVVWKKNFGGIGDDYFNSVTAVSDGFIAVGYSYENSFETGDLNGLTGKGHADAIIVKYNHDGSVAWKKNFGGSDLDFYTSVIAVSDGFVAVGYSYQLSFGNGDWNGVTGKGNADAIIVKYNHDGSVAWKKNFGGNGYDEFSSVTAVSDGIIAVGSSYETSFGNGDWNEISGKGAIDAVIVKYNNDGSIAWKKNFGGSSQDYYKSVTAVSDGIIAVGNSYETSFGNGDWTGVTGKGSNDAIIVKYNHNGSVAWKKNFGGDGADYYNSVAAVSDGIIAVGYSYSNTFGSGDWEGVTEKGRDDAIIVKHNPDGDVVWKKNFGGSANDSYYSVAAVSDGIIAVGNSGDFAFDWESDGDWEGVTGKGYSDAIIVKYTFTPVTNITDVPTLTRVFIPLPLTGSVVPSYASNQTIVWSVVNANGTGAAITDGKIFTATAGGTATVRATIAYGLSVTTDFTKDFEIIVFVPVTGITNVPTQAKIGNPLTLTGTVTPANATYKNIVWSVVNANGTGATISGSNVLNATNVGVVTVKATIVNGLDIGTDYEQNFEITIIHVPVTNIANVPNNATVGAPLTLTGTVEPSDASFKTIVWSVISQGTTGAIVSGNELFVTATGTAVIQGKIVNGLAMGTDYTQGFYISINDNFISVTDITDVPSETMAFMPLTLTGTVVPSNASNKTIAWSIVNGGSTNATITGNIFNATAEGIAIVKATVINGIAVGSNFEKNFTISVMKSGIDWELGIRNYEFVVYPNPTKGELTVSVARGHDSLSNNVEIFDISGHSIGGMGCISPAGGGRGWTSSGGGQVEDSNEIKLDISHLPNGIYFLRVNGKTVKIVKN